MRKTTTILAIVALAVVAAALVGVTYAQLATPNPTVNSTNPTTAPWCPNVNTANQPYCTNATDTGYTQGCPGYGAGPQASGQYQYGSGMMGGRGMMGGWGMGMQGRYW